MRHTFKYLVIVAALLGAGFFAAYLRFRPYLGREATYTDGQVTYESLRDDIRYAVWDAPLPLSPAVNTDDPESRPVLSPDGLYLVFVAGNPGLNRDLYVAPMLQGEPQTPEPLGVVNSAADEIAPAFGPDGLYFASDRVGGAGGFDLYRCSYHDGQFGFPEPLGGGINTIEDETDPFPMPGGNRLAFAATRERGRGRDYDLFLATPTTSADGAPLFDVAPIDSCNTPYDEREPAFTRDGSTLFFASDRDGGRGDFDLYRSIRERGLLLAPQPVDGVNTDRAERAPYPTEDGFALWFASNQQGDNLDLYRARSLELFRIPGKPIGWLDLLILVSLLILALLAWLARRWETLDIIYKCFLVALVIHLLMLWYFQRVMVEGDEIDLPGRDALFHVRVASASTESSSQSERNGALDRAQATVRDAMENTQPARSEHQVAESTPSAAPTRSVVRGEMAAAPTPSRRTDTELKPTETNHDASAEVSLADQPNPIERRSGAAPSLGIGDPRRAETPDRRSSAAPSRATNDRTAEVAVVTEASGTRPSATVAKGERRDLADAIAAASTRSPNRAIEPTQSGGATTATLDDRATPVTPIATDGAAGRGERLTDLAAGAQRFEANLRDRSSGPSRLPTASPKSGAFSEASPAPSGPTMRLATRGDEELAEESSSSRVDRSDVAFEPSHDVSEPVDVALQDQPQGGGDAGSRGDSNARTDDSAADERRDLLADLTPSQLGTRSSRRFDDATPTRRTFGVVGDLPTPAPTRQAMPELARADIPLPAAPQRDVEQTPYRNRFGSEKQEALDLHGGNEKTEFAVAQGLRYLASRQNKEGFWGSRDDYEEKYGYVCIGKSALCLLAFLGAGHTPISNTEYSDVARNGVAFLLSVQLEDVGHFGWTSAYSHGIATYALAECYALTKDETLREPLERAVAWIVQNQNRTRDRRVSGGWGYYNPNGPHYDQYSRVSVSSWQVMALESARLGGIPVDDDVFTRARSFMANSYDDRLGAFRYNHDPSRLSSSYPTLPASTPAALFVLSLLGDDLGSRALKTPLQYVLERRPKRFRSTGESAFVLAAEGNLYFWYYGSLAMFRRGGEAWETWNTSMKETLLPAQEKNGSWGSYSPYGTRARDTNQDRCYSTAMCVLTLEVYYRYFTPLLQVK